MAKIVDYTNLTDNQLIIGSYTIPARGEIVFNDGIGDALLDAQVGFDLAKRIDGVDFPDPSIARWNSPSGTALIKPDGTEVTPGGEGGGATWDTLSGKPAVIAAGANTLVARETIDAAQDIFDVVHNVVFTTHTATALPALNTVLQGSIGPFTIINGSKAVAGSTKGYAAGIYTMVDGAWVLTTEFVPYFSCLVTNQTGYNLHGTNLFLNTGLNIIRVMGNGTAYVMAGAMKLSSPNLGHLNFTGTADTLYNVLGLLATLNTQDKSSFASAINSTLNEIVNPKPPTAVITGTGEIAMTACLPAGYSLQPYGIWDLGTLSGRWTQAIAVKSSPSVTQIDFPDLEGIIGAWSLTGQTTNLSTFNFTKLKMLGGSMTLSSGALTTATFPELIVIGDNFTFSPVSGGTGITLSMPKLEVMKGVGSFTTQHVDMPELKYAPAQTTLSSYGDSGGTVNYPKLELLDSLTLTQDIASISLPALKTITRTLGGGFTHNGTTTLSMPLLETVGSIVGGTGLSIQIAGTGITSLSFPNLKQVGRQVLTNGVSITAPIDQTSVDAILVKLASLDGTNGFESFDGRTITLNGASTATPSATGLAAKATLIARGCTVTHN